MVGKYAGAVLDEKENEVQHEEQQAPRLKKLTLNTSVIKPLNSPSIRNEKPLSFGCKDDDDDGDRDKKDDQGQPPRREQPERRESARKEHPQKQPA